MAEVEFNIGHKAYTLTCQEGEAGRLPARRPFPPRGPTLAARAAALLARAVAAERELARLKANPQRVEVPVVPASLSEAMAELAARAEALAQKAEDQLPG